MRSNYIVLALALGVGSVSAACFADEPAQPATTPAQPAAQQTATTAASKNADAGEDEKRLLARGYKKEVRKGQTLYCRKEIKTGSHFETKQCGTAESMALAEQQARDLMQNSQNSSGSRVN